MLVSVEHTVLQVSSDVPSCLPDCLPPFLPACLPVSLFPSLPLFFLFVVVFHHCFFEKCFHVKWKQTSTLLVCWCFIESDKLAWRGPQEVISFLYVLRAGSNTSPPILSDVCLTCFWNPEVVRTPVPLDNLSLYFPIFNHCIWSKIQSWWQVIHSPE